MFLWDHKNTTVTGTISTIIRTNIITGGQQLSQGLICNNAPTREFHMDLCLVREGQHGTHHVKDYGSWWTHGIALYYTQKKKNDNTMSSF